MSAEIELKLAVAPRCAARVFRHPFFKGRFKGRMSRARLLTVYYDTPKFDLWRAQVSVRLRRTPAGWLQTVKWAGAALGGLHQRNEIEHAVTGQAIDVEGLAGHRGLEVLGDGRLRGRLKPLFVTEFERSTRMLALPDGGNAEASLDRGRIVCGTAVGLICELELELKAGSPQGLFDVAEALVKDLPVRPAHRSKAERGYLLAGLGDPPVKAKRVDFDPRWDIGRAAAGLMASGLVQVQSNEDGMLAGEDIEYLHQLRVGVRRLRSCVSALATALPEGCLDPMKGELKWLGSRLGAARDWDVFLHESLPQLTRGLAAVGDAAGPDELARAAMTLGERAARAARAAWRSKRTSLLLLDLGRIAAGGGFIVANEAMRQPVVPFSSALLERRLARVVRLGKRARSTAGIERLHELRVAVKKLRYAVEFFGALYPAGKPERFRQRLVRLQDCLGSICDATAMAERVREAAPANASLTDFVRGWGACVVHAQRRHFDVVWRQFRRSRCFW